MANWVDYVRGVFHRDAAARDQAAVGVPTGDIPTDIYGNLSVHSASRGLTQDYLTLSDALMARFIDYERMLSNSDCSSAVTIYSDDATTIDSSKDHVMWIECKDENVRRSLNDMLHKKLNIDEEIWEMAHVLVSMGNDIEEILVGPDGVVGLNFLPTPSVRRIEDENGTLKAYIQSFKGNWAVQAPQVDKIKFDRGVGKDAQTGIIVFEPWRCIHMRLRSKRRRAMYGEGILEPARWVWRRLILLEDSAMISRLTRAPSRFAFYVDVGKLPKNKAEKYMDHIRQTMKKKRFMDPRTGKLDLRYSPHATTEDFFLPVRGGNEVVRADVLNTPQWTGVEDIEYFRNKLHAALMVPKAYLGYDENQPSRATLCLAGDTKIPLLDGTDITIKEMADDGGDHWLYSCDKNGKVVPGLARNARLTRAKAKTVEVELDNGEVITCTPDHPVMRRDGSYEEAGKLKTGDSLMPLYRRVSEGALSGYEEVYDPGDDDWRYTHRMVTDALFEEVQSGEIRHHRNFDKRDNRPENIEAMRWRAHSRLHNEHVEKTLLRPDVVEKKLVAQKAWLETEAGQKCIHDNLVANRGPGSKIFEIMKTDEYREKHSDIMKAAHGNPDSGIREYINSDRFKENSKSHSKRMAGKGNSRWRDDANYECLVEAAESYRCTSIAKLEKWTGYSSGLIYRLISEQGMTYMEFAEKHMAPSKYRKSAYKRNYVSNHKVVDIRPGPVVDCYDIAVDEHHNFALSAGVFVHNSGEDARFGKSVLRIQKELRSGMKQVSKVHLAATGVDPAYVDFTLKMTVPSQIFELAQLEVQNTRAQLAQSMQEMVSKQWMLSTIFGLTDTEIEKIFVQKQEEMKADMAAQGEMGGGGQFEGRLPPPGSRGHKMLLAARGRSRGSLERDLFEHHNPAAQRRMEDKLDAILHKDQRLASQIHHMQGFLQELRAAIKPGGR